MSRHRAFRVIKQEIRVLGIDDGQFIPHTKGDVLVVGVVFRGGYSIDGVMNTKVAIDGLDATEKLAEMIKDSPHRRQLRLIMLNGVTLAGFNLVDLPKLHAATGLPVMALTQEKPDLDAIHDALKHLPDTEKRWQIIINAGELFEVTTHGVKIFVELAGLTLDEAKTVLALTSTRGSMPEPLRVAHLIASGVTS
ncbi:MAG: DUF99 family protein [Candidatus Bathyarchaeia archaeon]